MAKRLDALSPECLTFKKPRAGKEPSVDYKFDDWFDGSEWVLQPDVDFIMTAERFRIYALNVAAKRGMKLTTRISEGLLHLRAIPLKEYHRQMADEC